MNDKWNVGQISTSRVRLDPHFFPFLGLLIIGSLLLASNPSHSYSFSNRSSFGQNSVSTSFAGSGDWFEGGSAERPETFAWSGSLGFSEFKYIDSSNEQTAISRTYGGALGIDWDQDMIWEAGTGIQLSSTPVDQLSSIGVNLYWGHTHNFESTSFTPRITLSTTRYNQKSSSNTTTTSSPLLRRRRRSGTTSLTSSSVFISEIRQNVLSLDLSLNVWKLFTFRVVPSFYSYDKNPSQFLEQISDLSTKDSPQSTVSAFLLQSFELGVLWKWSQIWDTDVSLTQNQSAFDDSLEFSKKIIFSNKINSQWKVGLGIRLDEGENIDSSQYFLLNLRFLPE